jgi:hypothetical protein
MEEVGGKDHESTDATHVVVTGATVVVTGATVVVVLRNGGDEKSARQEKRNGA